MAVKHSTIESTLERGKYFSGCIYASSWIVFYLVILIPILSLIFAIVYAFGGIDIKYPDGVLQLTIPSGIAIIIAILWFRFFILKTIRYRQNIELWLGDAVLLYAHVKEIDRKTQGYRPSTICIEASFRYNKKKITKQSGCWRKGVFKKKYDLVFRKYAGHQVKILYSPAYDQVLFPKQNLISPTSSEIKIREDK